MEIKNIESSIGKVVCEAIIPDVPLKPIEEIEKSIQRKFRSELWTPFIHALKEFSMINDGDKIAVAISGGKDSLLLAKLFQEL
ncbi:MAG: tRNA 2-thiocytidine biosynthesis protein TtcA, partial [Fusobacterium gastrosuis]|nr:tRNA 2-thiocytidine biosynthesis protein TtcA [Fusobacterium gastrosuis]